MTSLVSKSVGLAVVVFMASHAGAAVWTESGSDAGKFLGTADVTLGAGTLTQINGSIFGPNDVDMYLIQITDPNTFSASGTGGLTFGPPKMFLFDAAGLGVTGYSDSTNTGAAITDTFVNSSGLYYLAYSGFSIPLDSGFTGGRLWDSLPDNTEMAPNGPSANNPLFVWGPSIVPFGPSNYTISLTGAAFVPEPTSLLLLAVGATVSLSRRRLT